ncbi:MAG: hypothetical protein CMA70_04750 [Euryarchaeota archaeon]|nr:hypothetical protein [Euryarchaeota archaeon]
MAKEVFKAHLARFKELGVSTITASYHGDSDSGAVETISFFDAAGELLHEDHRWDGQGPSNEFTERTYPNVSYMGMRSTFDKQTGLTIREALWSSGSLSDLVESLVITLLPGGWEINEGSSGEVVLDLSKEPPLVEVQHGWNVISTEYESFMEDI